MAENTLRIKPVADPDRPALARVLANRWGASTVVVHGTVFRPAELPGLIAVRDGRLAGLLTYDVSDSALEIVTLDAMAAGGGVGTALLAAVTDEARRLRVVRLLVTTTNDNLDALRFYQRRDFRLVGVRPGAADEARRLKPQIPEFGLYDIPLHDEMDLARELFTPGA